MKSAIVFFKIQRTFNRKVRKGSRKVRKELIALSFAFSAGCFSAFFAVSELSRVKNPDKTLPSLIDNQYRVALCQDLPGTTVMKFNKLRMKNLRQDFL